VFLPPTKFYEALSPSMWAFKRRFVRGMAGLM